MGSYIQYELIFLTIINIIGYNLYSLNPGGGNVETDLPAEPQVQEKSARFQEKNEDKKRPQRHQKKKAKREKETVSIRPSGGLCTVPPNGGKIY
jgi:hypothetical protein